MSKDKVREFLSIAYEIGFGNRPGWAAMADMSELLESKLKPAADEYDELMTFTEELERENAELRRRLIAYERGGAA